MHEGRMTSMRWLVMFVGIGDIDKETGIPQRPFIKEALQDVMIDRFRGGRLFEPKAPDAPKLSRVWKGCRQATSHPTEGTNHPAVSAEKLAEALSIVIDHLERTIYPANGKNLFDATFIR